MKQSLRKIHLWLSLPFGIIITIVCLTGALLVLENFIYPGAGHHSDRTPFFAFVFRLHRWLLDVPASRGAMSVGKAVVGVSVLAFVLSLLTGLVVWLPRRWDNVRSVLALGFRLRIGQGVRPLVRSLHVAGGLYALGVLLIMALTGLTWSCGWWRGLFISLTGIDRFGLYALHTGNWGGVPTQILWFWAALIGASLPVSGYYLWFKRCFKKNNR